MKIDVTKIDSESFMVHQHELFGEMVLLVQPIHIGAKYSKDTLIFRSSVWDMEGNLVSPSFRKFFNDIECPQIDPLPENIASGEAIEKIDGSTVIFSLFKNNLVMRTRGTVDARDQDNGYEFVQLAEKYHIEKVMRELNSNAQITLLFEITSPVQKIVIDYGPEPEFWLTGAVRHEDYSYLTQKELDDIATKYGFRRPKRYSFKSMAELQETVTAFRGVEGICFYFHGGQCIRKFKSANYLYLHRAKSEVASLEKVMDVYLDFFFNSGSETPPTYTEFFAYLEKTFDFEIATMATSNSSQICDGMKEVVKIIASLKKTVASCAGLSRKQAAYTILQSHGNSGRSSMMFKMLDGKTLDKDDYKKLLFQILKK